MNLYDRANSISQQISVEMATCPASASGPGDDLESQGLLISSNNALTLRDER